MDREKIVFDSDRAMAVHGVPGRLTHRTVKPGRAPGLWFKQRWVSEARPIAGYGKGAGIRAELRFDDELGNGHNSFAVTAEVRIPGRSDIEAGGCMHDEIAAKFPELAHLIKWHLTATDGPMHYIANAVYLAGDRDHNRLRKGERRQIRNGRTGELAWKLAAIVGDEQRPARIDGVPQYVDSNSQPPAPSVGLLYAPWYHVGEGKARDFDAARRVAVWPDATDEQLSAEPGELKAALLARLPALVAAFRADMESAGFFWSPDEYRAPGELTSGE